MSFKRSFRILNTQKEKQSVKSNCIKHMNFIRVITKIYCTDYNIKRKLLHLKKEIETSIHVTDSWLMKKGGDETTANL